MTGAPGEGASAGAPPFFSLVIPCRNEQDCIGRTCRLIAERFASEGIGDYEIVAVNDGSRDATGDVLADLALSIPTVRRVDNPAPHGFGHAVRMGLKHYRGAAVAVVMGDLSDSPDDIVAYYHALKNGAECVFGSRFVAGSSVQNYPVHKLVLNRLANWFIRALFRIDHNDITNAFKAYRREVIDGIQPLLSAHFNLTVEMPLKAVVRGYRFVRMPISWQNRLAGVSKLRIREMGSRYLFIVLYCWLEGRLCGSDYHRGRTCPD